MSARTLAAAFLAVGFAFVTWVALRVEPGMGFTSFVDFFDPGKVADGYASSVWRVENLLYLAFPFAFWLLAATSDDRMARWSGAMAGLFLLAVGAIDRVGIQMIGLVQDESLLRTSIAGLLPVRFGLLKCTVLAIGVFAWRTSQVGSGAGILVMAWKGLGWLLLLAGLLFLFAFVPAPLAISVWAIALTLREWHLHA
jgi:hypothetical protein